MYSRGFSLVELSIVLVILGLLTGGILSGQSLIRAAELRSASTEYQRYQTAAQTFRDKYFAIPGDMTNATSFWGTSAACPGTAGIGTQTCNGNGDGKLDPAGGVSQYGEWYMFWQHLANAGLIEGSYTGMSGPTNYDHSIGGTNSPKSKVSNAIWFIAYDGSTGSALFPIATTRQNFRLGGQSATSWPSGLILKPEEIWNIDTKLDDGKPDTGIVTSYLVGYAGAPNCTITLAGAAAYNLSYSSAACSPYFASGL